MSRCSVGGKAEDDAAGFAICCFMERCSTSVMVPTTEINNTWNCGGEKRALLSVITNN